jgi:hypothetical protein
VATARRELGLTRPVRLALLVATGGVYSWWLSSTSPFTSTAEVAVAVGFGLMAVVAGTAFFGRRPGTDQADRSPGSTRDASTPSHDRSAAGAWLLALSLVAVVELVTYFAGWSGNRHDFPTISSLYDTAAQSPALKAAVVFAWLALGWALFHREPGASGSAGAGPP